MTETYALPDVAIQSGGGGPWDTVKLFHPYSPAARAWLQENTDGMWIGGALAVETRYAGDLAEGLVANGFTLR